MKSSDEVNTLRSATALIVAHAWAPFPTYVPDGGDKKPLWKPIDFEFLSGDRVLLDGPSGCGKSTFLLALAGLLTTQRTWSETGVLFREKRYYGYLFQNPADRFCTVKVEDELAFGLENKGLDPLLIDRLVAQGAHLFGLDALLDRQVNRLSGGEQQRLALASLWVEDPEILFIDEAMSQLDADGRRVLLAAFDRWSESHPKGLAVVVDHRAELWEGRFTRALRWKLGTWSESPNENNARSSRKTIDARAIRKSLRSSSIYSVVASCNQLRLSRPGSETVWNHKPIDLELHGGKIYIIVGPNGSGKSTLLKTLAGLATFHSGEIHHGSLTLKKPPKRKKEWKALGERISIALQNPELQFDVGLVKDYDDKPPENFGLSSLMNKSPFELSLGQQRRLSLSMLGSENQLLLLDEPFYGQDSANTRVIIEYIYTCVAAGTAVVIICHDEDLSQALADELYLWDGNTLSSKRRKSFKSWWEVEE